MKKYLVCEHKNIFILLMTGAGMMGAYTFNVRGGVFCNAQTANIVMMGIALGNGKLSDGLYYLIPIAAYCLGAFVSEALPSAVKKLGLFRWDTWLVAFEMLILFIIGFIPLELPHQIVQVTINFIASMQYNTFRQAEGIPMATTFCTNHVRQVGIALAKLLCKHDTEAVKRGWSHAQMLLGFLCGGMLLTLVCRFFPRQSIWVALLPLAAVLFQLAYADIVLERGRLDQTPGGH